MYFGLRSESRGKRRTRKGFFKRYACVYVQKSNLKMHKREDIFLNFVLIFSYYFSLISFVDNFNTQEKIEYS